MLPAVAVAANEPRTDLRSLSALSDVGRAREDARLARLRQALDVLKGDAPDRAEQVQRLFSLDYDPAWKRPQPR